MTNKINDGGAAKMEDFEGRKEQKEPVFSIDDRGYNVKAWYLTDTENSKGDALIEICKDNVLVRQFLFPSYKIWNISAHFSDIVDGEIANSTKGYEMAAWTGF